MQIVNTLFDINTQTLTLKCRYLSNFVCKNRNVMCQPNDSRSMNLCTKFTITSNQAPTDRIFSVKRGFISVLFSYGNYVAWTPVAIINPIMEFSLTKEPKWKILQSHDFHSPQKYVLCACHFFFSTNNPNISNQNHFFIKIFLWINLMLLWFLFSNLK